jgi:hypothetical protein
MTVIVIIIKLIMKTIITTGFLLFFIIPFAFSQNVSFEREEGPFLKRIEHNMMLEAGYNLKSKKDIEKMFWGNFNAPIEFFYSPAFEGASGFRIVADLSNSFYMLEIKYIANMEWVRTFNRSEWLNQYKVDSLSFPVGARFAEDLYKKIVSLINNFTVKGMPHIGLDGYSVTFRTVVDDEVWSLWISNPRGKNAVRMSDLCRQIITDAKSGKLDEKRYMSVLDTFENR